MPLHVRHIDPDKSPRVQIRFLREDLLYKTSETLRSPEGTVTINGLPLFLKAGQSKAAPLTRAIGPTVLDMLTRTIVKNKDNSEKAVWALRDLITLWPDKKDKKKARPKQKAGEAPKPVDHPFKVALASGGSIIADEGDFIRVRKPTTVSISGIAFRLALGMYGDLDTTQKQIGEFAAEAWLHDLERGLLIFERVREAGGSIEENVDIAQLRPASSISQYIEEKIMRKTCKWLGVDPDKELPKRGRGRPRPSEEAGEEGKVIRITLHTDANGDRVTCELKDNYHGLAVGTDLGSLNVMLLIDVLGWLRIEGLDTDANLLETFLEVIDPEWRERAAGQGGATASPSAADPYEVLGVSSSATMDEVKAAYRRTMQQWHPDKGVGQVFAQMTIEAYRTIRIQRGEND